VLGPDHFLLNAIVIEPKTGQFTLFPYFQYVSLFFTPRKELLKYYHDFSHNEHVYSYKAAQKKKKKNSTNNSLTAY